MKKLSFLFVMVFAVGFAMAENNAKVSTTGNYNDALITQGIANNNTATILQNQNGSEGYHSLAQISQGASSWGKITQLDTRNYATITEALADKAEIYQEGKVNNSNISFEYGLGNNVGYVEQVGDYNSGYIKSTFHNNGNGSEQDPLKVWQHGNNNLGSIEAGWNAPSSNFDRASIKQTGNKNSSTVRLEGGDYNDARVVQTGDENHADLTQTGSLLVATIDQSGDKNIVNLNQTGDFVDIDQNGNQNEVRGLQTDPTPNGKLWATFAGATLDVDQMGDGNTLDLKSTSSGAVVDVYQNGMMNKSMVIQN
ncbi:MAG: hypothetical protein GZ091_17895 [Paludibacter sp.]|nr:hypothetical protein [Paludibacter sp.]